MVALNTKRTRDLLRQFDFKPLFIEELGWDHHTAKIEIPIDGQVFILTAIAQKRGMVAYHCSSLEGRCIPDYQTRRRIETQTAKSTHEHLIIYTDADRITQIWQWVKRETGKPTACREHPYHRDQPGDALIQKLQGLFFSIEEEEILSLPGVIGRVRAAFDVDRITKRFYDRFKAEHAAFLKFLKGIPDEGLQRWYASVMLNRLMFIYFIQKKNFLNGDDDYLRNKLRESQRRGRNLFYREFLCPLFFEGFAKNEKERSKTFTRLLGKVPYLNGGLFLKHQIEELHGETMQIADAAFENLFAFFEQYQWHLDERPLRADNEINPDVLGYIFEKYINQKQMGAYYTKEDITEYISKNTIIPFLFEMAKQKCHIAFECERSIWRLLQADPNRYIYEAVKKGVELPLPEKIAVGLNKVSERVEWNKPALPDYALPTEIWREVVARRKRYKEVKSKISGGEIRDINDLITCNLNIRQFAQDVIESSEGSELLSAFWHAIESVTILDPTCGSGAFLFAALNILEPLYEACLNRMEVFLDELERSGEKHHPEKFSEFHTILKRVELHPNPRYFIMKSIILNNLYGVDIMEEAIEICKLRLFLKLVAQVERVENIEPLPDIDFNVRAGNTLVGFASLDDVKKAMEGDMIKLLSLPDIEEKAEIADSAFNKFREMQTERGMEAKDFADAKNELTIRRKTLENELNRYLATEYGIDPKIVANAKAYESQFNNWLASHKPFHWFIEFYGIIKNGGFDVVIGNPPYVEYNKVKKDYTVRGFKTETCGNLYAFVFERCHQLLRIKGRMGLIVPISLVCTQRMGVLQDILLNSFNHTWHSNYAERPARLFSGAEVLLTISLSDKSVGDDKSHSITGLRKWSTDERPILFNTTSYEVMPEKIRSNILPKISSPLELQIINKLWRSNRSLVYSLRVNTDHKIFYRIGGGRYWKVFTSFQPNFVLNGKPSVSSRENYLFFDTSQERDVAIATLSSTLFYWYFILTTNGRDLNPSDLNEFPISITDIMKSCQNQFVELTRLLMTDYQMNKCQKRKFSKLTGNILYEEFYPRLSKSIIDEIDRVLAKRCGFTDEELDFIINYDIKYRMGRDSFEENEE